MRQIDYLPFRTKFRNCSIFTDICFYQKSFLILFVAGDSPCVCFKWYHVNAITNAELQPWSSYENVLDTKLNSPKYYCRKRMSDSFLNWKLQEFGPFFLKLIISYPCLIPCFHSERVSPPGLKTCHGTNIFHKMAYLSELWEHKQGSF